jgi:hypothetical protein
MRHRLALFTSFAILAASAAHADSTDMPGNNAQMPLAVSDDTGGLFGQPPGAFSAAVKLGTLGIGGEVGYRPLSYFGLRIDGEAFSFSDTITAGRVNYNATAELQSYGLLADVYPFGESFRLTGGLRLNENEIRGQAESVRLNTSLGPITVPTGAAGSLGGKVTFDKLSPYTGFGWGGSIAPGLSLTTDFGVMFNGNPKGSVAASGPLAGVAYSTGSVAAAQSDLQNAINGYKYFPVIEIGLSYKF